GRSVALSADGNTAIIGGLGDGTGSGAVWGFTRDGGVWTQQGDTGLGNVPANWSVVGVGDFNGGGMSDILWRDRSGHLAVWEMNGGTVLNINTSGLGNVPTNWSVVGIGDFNGDGMSDILWRDPIAGDIAIWEMNGTTVLNINGSGVGNVPAAWSVAVTGDL